MTTVTPERAAAFVWPRPRSPPDYAAGLRTRARAVGGQSLSGRGSPVGLSGATAEASSRPGHPSAWNTVSPWYGPAGPPGRGAPGGEDGGPLAVRSSGRVLSAAQWSGGQAPQGDRPEASTTATPAPAATRWPGGCGCGCGPRDRAACRLGRWPRVPVLPGSSSHPCRVHSSASRTQRLRGRTRSSRSVAVLVSGEVPVWATRLDPRSPRACHPDPRGR